MKLCIPSSDSRGLQSEPAVEFGQAPFYTIVHLPTRHVQVVANASKDLGSHASCMGWRALHLAPGDEVIVRRIGRSAHRALTRAGIGVRATDATDVAEALELYLDGRSRPVDAGELCCGCHHHAGVTEAEP
ncbi:MAG TPA: NifB/NifX family molybdenum-iron cluster-binding protein [Gemmatimonadaceae bacterium]|nr:NifB/NifX family molybdenum-iron cluster-binding protein [Gemmatimonadaceae bacterium]